MKFLHFVELITTDKPSLRMTFIWKLVISLVLQDFTVFASTINAEF